MQTAPAITADAVRFAAVAPKRRQSCQDERTFPVKMIAGPTGAIRGNRNVRPAARHAQRTCLLRRLALILLTALPPASAVAGARISAWQTETIPHAAAPAPAVQGAVTAPPRQLNVFEQQAAETIKITNAFRRRNGLPPFEEDPVCVAAAFDHAQDMARRSYFDHFGPDGSSPTRRYQRRNTSGQRVIRVTENIARGNGTTPESALRMWLELLRSPQASGRKGDEPHRCRSGQRLLLFGPCTYFVQCFSRWP